MARKALPMTERYAYWFLRGFLWRRCSFDESFNPGYLQGATTMTVLVLCAVPSAFFVAGFYTGWHFR